MDPLIGSSLISGGSGLLSGLFNIGSARRANKRMVEFWKMQNEYNHPAAQRKRLEEAGLNPALMYGKSASPGIAGSVGQPARAELNLDNPMAHLTKFADVKLREVQADNVRSQNSVNVQQEALLAAKTAGEILKNKATRYDWNVARDLARTSADAAKQNLRKSEQQTFGIMLDNQLRNETMKAEIYKSYYQIELLKQTNDYRNAQIELMKQLKYLRSKGLDKAPWYGRMVYEQAKDLVPNNINPYDTKQVLEYLGSQRPARKSEAWRNKYKPQPINK